jgi:outer membrane murein-binding lipoprotein Lpp
MRTFLISVLLCSLLLTGCEFFTPDTSRALSQTRQMEEMQKQTQQLERQADALERLVDRTGEESAEGGAAGGVITIPISP